MTIKNKNPKTDWSIGDSAYMFIYGGELVCGHITNIVNNTYTVTSPFYTFDKEADELFMTTEDAWASAEAFGNRATDHYKSEIKDLKDLLQFALRVPVAPCEEYTDDSAIKAFRERAQELTGIEL